MATGAANLQSAATGAKNLTVSTRQTASKLLDGWEGEGGTAYGGFMDDIGAASTNLADPMSQIATLVQTQYLPPMQDATQAVQAYNSVAQTAQVSGNSALIKQAAQLLQTAQSKIAAWQAAGNQVAGQVTDLAGQMGSPFPKGGPVQKWIGGQSQKELISLSGMTPAPGPGKSTEIFPIGPQGGTTEIFPIMPTAGGTIIDPIPPKIGTGTETYPIGPQGPSILYAKNPNPKTKGEIDEQAGLLGYPRKIPPQRAPFNSHGQPVYTNGKGYISPDVDGHKTSNGWKMFNKKGQRTGTYNWDLSKRVGN